MDLPPPATLRVAPEPLPEAPLSPGQIIWRRFKRSRLAMTAGAVLIAAYLISMFAGFIAPYHYETQDRQRFNHPPLWPRWLHGRLAMPKDEPAPGEYKYRLDLRQSRPLRLFVRGDPYSFLGLFRTEIHLFGTGDPNFPVYLLGTDQFGRDVFSRLLYGSRVSLSIGILGIALSFLLGLIMGGVSGYAGGWTDTAIMRLCELIMSVPGLYLIISLRAVFPPKLSSAEVYGLIIMILSFIRWARLARVIRGMALSLRERPFVLAARALGQSHWRVITRHILPSTFSFVIVEATLSVPYYILGEVVLSFLGVGIQEPDASWGLMLTAAQNTEALRSFPWLLAPGAAIFVTVLAFNFLGDGLRDAVDTRSAIG